MKRLLLILVVTASLVACKKSSTTTTAMTKGTGIAGWWELRRTSGGLRPDSIYASGNGNIYEFNSNNTYKKYQATVLVAQGTYQIADYPGPSANGVILIYFDNSTTGEQLQYDSQTLTIGTSAADGPAWTYQKISN
jgi:pectate lyase